MSYKIKVNCFSDYCVNPNTLDQCRFLDQGTTLFWCELFRCKLELQSPLIPIRCEECFEEERNSDLH